MNRSVARVPAPGAEGDEASTDAAPAKRLLFVFGSLERAGAQLRTLEVCRELRRTGSIEFDFCYLDLGPNELTDDVAALGGSVHRISIRSPRFFGGLSRLLRVGRYDIVHTEPQFLSGFVVWLAALRGVPIRIVAIHNSIGDPGQTARKAVVRFVLASRPFQWAMRALMTRYATTIVGVSRSALDSVLPGGWQRRRRCVVVYNGTDLIRFREPVDGTAVREEFGWPSESRIVVNIGRLSVQKNHPVILRTVARLRETDRSVRLLLIGGTKAQLDLDPEIDALGLRDACAILHNRRDVPRLLLASDVFFFPSAWEGLPGAPLEALAAGLTVVASDIPPMREIASHFPDAMLLAPPNAVEGHLEHLAAALAAPRDRAATRERFAASPFSLERCVGAYRGLYGIAPEGARS